MKTLKDFNFTGKRVLLRCDLNVSLQENGEIAEDFRIKQSLPTIEYLIRQGAKVIIMSHLGDPKGQVVENLRLDRVASSLSSYLNQPVLKLGDILTEKTREVIHSLSDGEVVLLENLRFFRGEEENEVEFSKKLASLAEFYVNDAFGVCHRLHASIVGVPRYLEKAAGLLLEKELSVLGRMINSPDKPLVVIIGGKKVETKARFVERISKNADSVLVSGLIQKEIQKQNLSFPKIVFPPDERENGFDVGPETEALFREKILGAKTVFWNGPMGKFEDAAFASGTRMIAEAIIESKAFSIIGGGETIEAVNKFGLLDKFNHVSTGGGAMLMFLGGEQLPGVAALEE